MSKIKNFDQAMHASHFQAISYFIKEGMIVNYAFPVCTKEAAYDALVYLCANDIEHSYTCTPFSGVYLITLNWRDKNVRDFYCFWCEGEI